MTAGVYGHRSRFWANDRRTLSSVLLSEQINAVIGSCLSCYQRGTYDFGPAFLKLKIYESFMAAAVFGYWS